MLFSEDNVLVYSYSSSSVRTVTGLPAAHPLHSGEYSGQLILFMRRVSWWIELIVFRQENDLVASNTSSSIRKMPWRLEFHPLYIEGCHGRQQLSLFFLDIVLLDSNSNPSINTVCLRTSNHPIQSSVLCW
jgi:hypothetical protein